MEYKAPYIINFKEKINKKPGKLIAINDFEIDMNIKRILYIYGFSNDTSLNNRGYHGHQNTTQILILLNGTVNIITKKIGNEDEQIFKLNMPHIGVKIPPNNFIKMTEFSQDAILLVLCDTIFSEDIYLEIDQS